MFFGPLPTPSDVPNAGAAVTSVASTVSNSLTSEFVAILPYVVAVVVLFTVVALVFRLFHMSGGSGVPDDPWGGYSGGPTYEDKYGHHNGNGESAGGWGERPEGPDEY